jgi:hypothetical protein
LPKISQISRKSYPFRYRKPPGHPTDLIKIEPLQGILSLKTTQYSDHRKTTEGYKREKNK